MTTIAYSRGVLASDSRLVEGEYIVSDRCRKIWRLRDGSLFGAAGENEPGLRLFEALRKNQPFPKFADDVEMTAVHIKPNGHIYFTEGTAWTRWLEPYITLGTGMPPALAALRLGRDAVSAVRMGIAGDPYSGGRVQKLSLRRKR